MRWATTVWTVYHTHTPPRRFSKVDCSTTKRVPIRNDTSLLSFRRDASNADLFGTATIPTIPTILTTVEISSIENRPRGV